MEAVGNDSYRRTPLLLEILEYLHNDQFFVGNLKTDVISKIQVSFEPM
jgi:hypothetical protein